MDLKESQLASKEQRLVLRTLATSAACPNCKFLEVGSWLGESTVILAKVARKYGGHLYCVDWWRGNEGTDLYDIASRVDILSVFWSKICKENLQDVVVPIRARSDLGASILRENSFNFVFLDADHRYKYISADIKRYVPLVSKHSGILCGHDCEGRIADYDTAFLRKGKNTDYFETVHCGVVLAVGERFSDYSVNHNIWSVQFSRRKKSWMPTKINLKGISDERQTMPSPLGDSPNNFFFRYGRNVYAIPKTHNFLDVRSEKDLVRLNGGAAHSCQALEEKIGERIMFRPIFLPDKTPNLIEEGYRGFNIVQYDKGFYSVAQCLGHIDWGRIEDYVGNGQCFASHSLSDAKKAVNDFFFPILVEENYLGFNIVKSGFEFYAISQNSGSIDFTDPEVAPVLERHKQSLELLSGPSLPEMKISVHTLRKHQLEEDMLSTSQTLALLREENLQKSKSLDSLGAAVLELNKSLAAMQTCDAEKDQEIKLLTESVTFKEADLNKFESKIRELNGSVAALKASVAEKDVTIKSLSEEISRKGVDLIQLDSKVLELTAAVTALQSYGASRDEKNKLLGEEILRKDEVVRKVEAKVLELNDGIRALQAYGIEKDGEIRLLSDEAVRLNAEALKVSDSLTTLHAYGLEQDKKISLLENEFFKKNSYIGEIDAELRSIKSRRWYRLMNWMNSLIKGKINSLEIHSKCHGLTEHTKKFKVSVILLDWSCRESVHTVDQLNNQTIPRDEYEIIWIEYYDRVFEEMAERKEKSEKQRLAPFVDKWFVLGVPNSFYYHKHFMYNVGLFYSRGDIVVICDSDALVKNNFIETVIAEFERDPNIVLHLDELRNFDRKYYPLKKFYPHYPSFEEMERGDTTGVEGKPHGLVAADDLLHKRNYGACFCAKRDDLIAIGGADEHMDYLGHICGPYEMTFRLANVGKREVWHQSHWIYHAWHPGQAGDKNYWGPNDGLGMSSTALKIISSGRVKPKLENEYIKALRLRSIREEELSLVEFVGKSFRRKCRKRWKIDFKKMSETTLPCNDYQIVVYTTKDFGLFFRKSFRAFAKKTIVATYEFFNFFYRCINMIIGRGAHRTILRDGKALASRICANQDSFIFRKLKRLSLIRKN